MRTFCGIKKYVKLEYKGGVEVNYVNVGYDSTNHYAITSRKGYILIDVGMPGTMKKLVYSLRDKC